jgi:hypothetical protein
LNVTRSVGGDLGGVEAADRSPLRIGWKARFIIVGALFTIRMLSLTWRLRRVNPAQVDTMRSNGQPVVFAFWHGHILPLLHAHRHENITVLVSEHVDGEMIARIAGAFGFPSVRGSSSHGAVRSLLTLVRVVKGGGDVGVTPDGPRGPARTFAPGVLLAAGRSGAPLVTIAAHASSAWRLRTWDGFVIPRPFTTITVAYGNPTRVGDVSELQERALEFQLLLNDTCAQAGER